MKRNHSSLACPRLFTAAFCILTGGTGVWADWPQFRGPTLDWVSTDRINRDWSGAVTNAVWLVHLTNGITSLAVGGGRVFTKVAGGLDEDGFPHREYCLALSAANGVVLWSTQVDAAELPQYLYPNGGVGHDDGPRSTPTVSDGSVFVLSSYLNLLRLNATNGGVIWSNNLRATYGANVIEWQNAASPVLEDGLIFVNGNAGTQRLMAFNATNGTLVWRSQNEAMTHTSPVLAAIHGIRQVIFATQSGLVSLTPATGALLWKVAYPFHYQISLGTSPVVHQDHVFITANYAMSAYAVQVALSNSVFVPVPRWTNTVQRSHWSTPLAHAGHLYGMFYPDTVNAELRCVDLMTGVTRWATGGFGRSSLLRVGTNLVCLTERGAVVLVAAQTNAYQELARFQAIPNYHGDLNKCWNGLALSDGQLYVRSTAYAARFDLSVPPLRLDLPQFSASDQVSLAIRTVTGAPVPTNRLASLEVRASTNLGLVPSLWPKLTNALALSNGVVRVTNVDAGPPRRFFLVTEPP